MQEIPSRPAAATPSSTSQGLPAGFTQESSNKFECVVCQKSLQSEQNVTSHFKSHGHRLQCILLGIKKNKSQLIQNKDGIEITSSHDKDDKLDIVLPVERGETGRIDITITNVESTETVVLRHCELLKRRKGFVLDDVHKVTERKNHQVSLRKGTEYHVTFTVGKTHFLGRRNNILAFAFTKEGSPDSLIHILRDIRVVCVNQIVQDLMPKSPYAPPPRVSLKKADPDLEQIEGEPLPPLGGNSLERELDLDHYRIPALLRTLMNRGWEPKGLKEEAKKYLEHIRKVLYSSVIVSNHKENFSILLHMEELQMEVDIRKYDMKDATMSVCKSNKKLLTLKVPGLAENRPSILKGDVLWVRKKQADGKLENKEYKGYVHDLWETEVHLGFSSKLRDQFVSNMKFSVRFTVNPLPSKLVHRALELCESKDLDRVLFPDRKTICSVGTYHAVDKQLSFYDRQLEQNTEQKRAVQHMVAGTSRPAPYLLFGPPGTGKTVTVVEAVKQIVRLIPNSHVLACAPSNSAADLLAQRLRKHLDKREMFRMNAMSRMRSTVPDEIRDCCNYDDKTKTVFYPNKDKLKSYRVIICTLITAGRIVSANFPEDHFTHVVIDEAGHAMEPEALTAIAGVLAKDGGQVILAGDPEQLGPVLRSPKAIDHGLGMSFLERLMKHCEVYQRKSDANDEEIYDPRLITKLVRNYRSHPTILKIPNEFFYHDELKPHADKLLRESLCQWEKLPKKNFPVIFHGVVGEDLREERSPSFFNPQEAAEVLDYVTEILGTKKGGINVQPKHIGVITPYRKQVEKIRKVLKSHKDIKVGSVEEFQGQERKVIIISTVRSSPQHLSMDRDFKLGFLTNPKRFNVALTRAQALLIVIGNPHVLQRDLHWSRFLEYCRDNKAYIDNGCDLDNDDDGEDSEEDMIQRFAAVKLDTIVDTGEDPEWRSEN